MKDAELSAKLIDLVGPTLVSLASGSSNQNGAQLWRAGVVSMSGVQRQRLEVALECLEAIVKQDGSDIARAWFIGGSTGNDTNSPVEALCEGRLDDVRISMQRFVNAECMGG